MNSSSVIKVGSSKSSHHRQVTAEFAVPGSWVSIPGIIPQMSLCSDICNALIITRSEHWQSGGRKNAILCKATPPGIYLDYLARMQALVVVGIIDTSNLEIREYGVGQS